MAVKIIEGKNGFLFLRDGTNNVIDQITGKKSLGAGDLSIWEGCLNDRLRHAKTHGYKYLYYIVPNKHCVYAEYLPDDISISNNRSAIQLSERFPDVVLYPLDALRGREGFLLYFKHDTHWNKLGAAVALNDLLGNLAGKNIEYEIGEITVHGDLGDKLNPRIIEPSHTINFEPTSKLVYDNQIMNIGRIIIRENQDAALPSAVIFGDSFFTGMADLLGEYFSKLYYFHSPVFDKEIIEKIKPDYVISENIERFVNKCTPKNSFREEVYGKFFRINLALKTQVGNCVGDNDPVSGIDHQTLNAWTKIVKSSKNDSELDNARGGFLKEHNLLKYFPFKERLFTGVTWTTNISKFDGWAGGYFHRSVPVPVGFTFVLSNLYANSEFFLNIYEVDDNAREIDTEKTRPLWSKNYKYGDLYIYANVQEVVFRVPDFQYTEGKCYVVGITGEGLLGGGASYNDLPDYAYFHRGYYKMKGSKKFKSIANNSSLAFRPVF